MPPVSACSRTPPPLLTYRLVNVPQKPAGSRGGCGTEPGRGQAAALAARAAALPSRKAAITAGMEQLRALAAYVEALGGRLEIIADFGDQRLAFAEPGIEAACPHLHPLSSPNGAPAACP